jgi:hypothetical protein
MTSSRLSIPSTHGANLLFGSLIMISSRFRFSGLVACDQHVLEHGDPAPSQTDVEVPLRWPLEMGARWRGSGRVRKSSAPYTPSVRAFSSWIILSFVPSNTLRRASPETPTPHNNGRHRGTHKLAPDSFIAVCFSTRRFRCRDVAALQSRWRRISGTSRRPIGNYLDRRSRRCSQLHTYDASPAEDTSRGIPTDLRGNRFDSSGTAVFRDLRPGWQSAADRLSRARERLKGRATIDGVRPRLREIFEAAVSVRTWLGRASGLVRWVRSTKRRHPDQSYGRDQGPARAHGQ